ncbi:MAG: hypothetical protein ACRCX4_11125 [Bacteroidales bacterium]
MRKENKNNRQNKRETERPHKILLSFNEKEYEMLCAHLKKHRIQNKSRWARETLLSFLWKKLEDNYPTLFDDIEMRQ